MKKYLTYKDEKSDKFWSIEVSEDSFTVVYGKTGTAGTSQLKTFENNEKCLKEANKLIKEKTAKGYKEAEIPATKENVIPTKKKKASETEKIESNLNITLPKRLKTFFDSDEYKKYEGMMVSGLPGYTADTKFKVKFYTSGMMNDLLEDNEIDMPDDNGAYYIPFIELGEESQFLGIDISKGDTCPVAMWEHEDGMFHLHSASLDEFLPKLLKKGEQPPLVQQKKTFEKAQALYSKKKYEEALVLLNGIMEGMSLEIPEKYEEKRQMGALFNLCGICKNKTKNGEGAVEDYKVAMACGDNYAGLNIIDFYIDDKKDYTKALEFVNEFEKKYLDGYCRFHAYNYQGIINIHLQNSVEAENIYKKILEEYVITDPDKIEKSIKSLKEIETKKLPGFEIAVEFLKWFGPKRFDLTTEQIQENRQWWNNLPSFGAFWQPKLKEAIKLKVEEPSDNDIATMFEIKSISFEKEEPILDLKPFEKLINLERIDLYGDLENLDILKNLKSLKNLTYNGKVNKNFKIPSKLIEPFIEAAENGNLEEIKEFLKKGVDINAKVDCESALYKAISGHYDEIALFLVQQGANIYSQVTDERYPISKDCNPILFEKLEKEFIKCGGVKKESLFCIIEKKMERNIAQLSYLANVESDYKLRDGESLKNDFPADAFFPMRKDYPGFKKDTALRDCFIVSHLLVGNTKVKNYFESNKISNVEILPVKIKNHAEEFITEEYFIINPLAVDCLDVDKSEPKYNHICPDDIDEVQSIVIDEQRLPADIKIFRIKDFGNNLFVRKAFANELIKQGFSGIDFKFDVDE